MIFGKLIAGLLGLIVAGIPGAFFGVVLGHLFDRGLAAATGFGNAGIGEVKERFFNTIFLLMGYVAKADGRVSEQEIAHVEQVFRQLGLDDAQRNKAIELFKLGTGPEFSAGDAVQSFLQSGGAHPALKQTLLFFLITLAHADGKVDNDERDALRQIGALLGYSDAGVDQLLRMAGAQSQFHQRSDRATPANAPTTSDAYAALGVDPQASDKDIKRAYRKLMSENHPDKLSARGVPEDMLKMATERSQEIQAAYELIREQRGMSKSG